MRAAYRTAVTAMPEADLTEQVRQYARDLGIELRYHTHRSQHSPAGFPDEVLLGRRGILFRELKRQGKHPTPDQQAWLDGLSAVGLDADVWRPADLLSGRILAEMRAIA